MLCLHANFSLLWAALFFVASVLADKPGTSPTLRQVNVLYRHGDRSPASIYPKDKHQVGKDWPDGLGWLTNRGKQQQFELGQWIRKTYDGFLDKRYKNTEIKIQASGVPRCLMSAEANLAGLYPPDESPNKEQIWNPQLNWQPIPVQTSAVIEDNKLAIQAPCPRYEQLMAQEMQSAWYKEEEKNNTQFYAMIVNETGVTHENLRDIWMVTDALICERHHNMTWNDWVKPDVWAKLDTLRTESFDMLYGLPEMSKLKGGPLLGEIVGNLNMAAKNITNILSPRFHMYSAHDTTVAALLSAMQVWNMHQPPYRAMVMVELHEINSQAVVKVFYRNVTDTHLDVPPTEVFPPGCSQPCKLSEFVATAKQRIPVDWTQECGISKSQAMALSPASAIALLVGVGLVGVVVVALLIVMLRLRARRNQMYAKI